MGLQGDLDNNSPFSTRLFRLLLKSLSNHLQSFVFLLDLKQLYLENSQKIFWCWWRKKNISLFARQKK